MNITSDHLYADQARRMTYPTLARRAAVPRHVTLSVYLVTGILATMALYLLISALVQWGQVTWDDLRYGRPRAMHITGFVGHDDTNGVPTHFIAMNLNRQVIVLEIPGGDASKTRSYPGPYLFGDNEELTPVQISLSDMDHDGLPDLLINVSNEQVIYLNKDGSFRLPEPGEQARIVQEQPE